MYDTLMVVRARTYVDDVVQQERHHAGDVVEVGDVARDRGCGGRPARVGTGVGRGLGLALRTMSARGPPRRRLKSAMLVGSTCCSV